MCTGLREDVSIQVVLHDVGEFVKQLVQDIHLLVIFQVHKLERPDLIDHARKCQIIIL